MAHNEYCVFVTDIMIKAKNLWDRELQKIGMLRPINTEHKLGLREGRRKGQGRGRSRLPVRE